MIIIIIFFFSFLEKTYISIKPEHINFGSLRRFHWRDRQSPPDVSIQTRQEPKKKKGNQERCPVPDLTKSPLS
jgi:hypothetical protein